MQINTKHIYLSFAWENICTPSDIVFLRLTSSDQILYEFHGAFSTRHLLMAAKGEVTLPVSQAKWDPGLNFHWCWALWTWMISKFESPIPRLEMLGMRIIIIKPPALRLTEHSLCTRYNAHTGTH